MNDEQTITADPPEETEPAGIELDQDFIKATVIERLDALHTLYVSREEIDASLPGLKGRALTKAEKVLAKMGEEIEGEWTFVSMRMPDEAALLRLRATFEAVFQGDGEQRFAEMYDEALTPPAQPLPEYAHCACGAALVMADEQAGGVCEACGHLAADGTLHATPEEAAAVPEPTGELAPVTTPKDVPLPFPPEPFDLAAAWEDVAKKNRAVESCRKVYEELKSRASDAKKQWEAAVTLVECVTSQYDAKYRAWLEAEERQVELEAAYREKLEAEAAKAAEPELPLETSETTADARVPDLGAATPLSDALPTCGLCENKLALDTEVEAGICTECAK